MTHSTDDVAKAGRTTLRGVRLWEANDLFGPIARDGNGYRVFSEAHIQRARVIAAAQMAGMSLSEIKSASPAQLWEKIDQGANFMAEVRASIFQDFDL